MIKRCAILLLFLSSLGLKAQEIPDSSASFKKMADWVLAPLIQNNVPSRILLDRVHTSGDLIRSGTDTIPDSTTGGQFIQILYDLEEASLDPSPEKPHQQLMAEIGYQNQRGIIPLGMIRMEVQGLDTSLIDDSSLVITASRQLKIQDGLSVNPFFTRKLNFASAMVLNDLEANRMYTIEYPRLYTNFNAGSQISYVRIRIDQGPVQVINPGESIQHSFQSSGNHAIDLEIGWEDGAVARSTTPVSVTASCSDPDPSDELACWQTEYPASCGNTSQAISADIEFQGKKGKAEVYYYRRSGATDCDFAQSPIRNPIIFVDGIDFGDTRKGQAIYGKYLRYLVKNPNGTTSTLHLGDQLRTQNRDIMILNFPNGKGITKYVKKFNPATERWEWVPEILYPNQAVTDGKANPGIDGGCDFIERNAMILVKLIQLTKSRMADPNEKIILVGPSMGGLISRYALAYMEKNQATTGSHNCKLFISQDSPQLGANIPIGIQALLKNLGEGFGVAAANEFLKDKLNQPAAQEMLLNHIEGNGFGPHPNRSTFLLNQISNSKYNSLGWPMDPGLKKIAIINGSLMGKPAISDPVTQAQVTAGGRIFDFNI